MTAFLLPLLLALTQRPVPAVEDCVTSAIRSTGTTHYYCACGEGADSACVAGNDSNSGLTPARAKASISGAFTMFNTMASGNTVALCRGGVFSGSTVSGASCSPTNTCDFRDYVPTWGSSSTARPVIDGGTSNIFAFWNGSTGGIRLWNLDLRVTGTRTDGIVQITNDMHDLDICNVSFTNGYDSINMSASGTYPTNIKIRGSQFYGAGFCGFYGGSPGIAITGNTFSGNGTLANASMHSVYLISESGGRPPDAASPATYTFSNNTVTTGAYCAGAMVVIHGVFVNNHVLMENNLISTTSTVGGCYGVMMSGGNSGAQMHGAVFRRNRAMMTQPIQSGLSISCCQDCTVSDNIVSGGQFAIDTNACPPGTNQAGFFTSASGVAQNNTVYGSGSFIVGANGTGTWDLDNNAVWTSGGTCYALSGTVGRKGNNYCRSSSSGVTAASVFVDAPNGNFKPVARSPLIGYGSSTHYSATAIGTAAWSATDRGVARSPAIDAGAMVH